MTGNRFDDLFEKADSAFDGIYSKELNQLAGLSKEEIEAVTPGNAGSEIYAELISVVEKASKDNLSQAQLIGNIKALGDVAVRIAKKVPGLAAWL